MSVEATTMFEKEAEEYARQSCYTEMPNPSLSESIDISDDIKEAVMFGYNKANERTSEMDVYLRRAMVLLRRLVYLSSHGYHIEYPTAFNRYVTQAKQLLEEFEAKKENK